MGDRSDGPAVPTAASAPHRGRNSLLHKELWRCPYFDGLEEVNCGRSQGVRGLKSTASDAYGTIASLLVQRVVRAPGSFLR